jgi:hypothetical protein
MNVIKQRLGFAKELASFVQIGRALRLHKSIPSARISCMSGVRSL